jgi:hypothetical protein
MKILKKKNKKKLKKIKFLNSSRVDKIIILIKDAKRLICLSNGQSKLKMDRTNQIYALKLKALEKILYAQKIYNSFSISELSTIESKLLKYKNILNKSYNINIIHIINE